MMRPVRFFCMMLLCLSGLYAQAQLPLIDRGVQVNGLWCFPLYNDTLNYVYLPFEADFARHTDNTPKFSFMRYVMNNARSDDGSGNSIQEADGGALLNFLVLYRTPDSLIPETQRLLRERLQNDSVKLRGPIVLDKGRYSLVSSVITNDSIVQKKQLLSVGNAPVLENSSVALSFGLTPYTSKILNENFRMSTPDVSLVFDMEFSGLTEDYDAELEVNWSEVRKHQGFSAGGTVYFVSADVKLAFDELFRQQAVKLKVVGNNPNMEGLLNTVYDKLLALLFEPVQPEQLPVREQGGMIEALAQSFGSNGILSSRNTTGFGVNVGYQLKEMNTSGVSTLRFKGRSTVQRHHYITFNIGDLHHRYGNNPAIFRDAPLHDAAFQQRSIVLNVDGDLEQEFDKMLNSVTVILEKPHLNGKVTTQNVVLTSRLIKEENKMPALVYGYHQDTTKWLEYRYRTIWQFKGGATYESGWKTQDAAMINLFIPYKRKSIELEGDMDQLKQRGIRAFSVQIEYPFFSDTRKERLTVRVDDTLKEKKFSITQPNESDEVLYNITWITNGGDKIENAGSNKIGIIFVDELPQ